MTLFGRDSLHHVVDGDARRLRPRARHAADAGPAPGRVTSIRSPRRSPAASCTRCASARARALARRRQRLLRQRRRDAAVRHAARRAPAVGQPPGGGRRAAPRSRPRARLDRRVRRPRRRRLRRVPAHLGPRARRTRAGRTRWDSVHFADGRLAEAPIALCEVQGYVYAALLARAHFAVEARRRRARRTPPGAGRRPEGPLQPRLLARGPRLVRDGSRPRQAADRRARRRTWATASGPGSSTTTRRRSSPSSSLSDELFSGWGIRTLATSMTRLQPDQLPQRQRVAARQRAVRGRPRCATDSSTRPTA